MLSDLSTKVKSLKENGANVNQSFFDFFFVFIELFSSVERILSRKNYLIQENIHI